MNVLSLFDGISCGRVALERAGITVDKYYASEIDKYAIQVAMKNYPDTIQLGDITKWREWNIDWSSIGILIGGSPCQGFSFAGKQLNFEDPRSKLFFVYVDILEHIKSVNPDVIFLLENVKMKKESQDVISMFLGVDPIEINSALVSAQSRKRMYWTNIKNVSQPEDRGVCLKDVLLPDTYTEFDKAYCLTASYNGAVLWNSVDKNQRTMVWNKPIRVATFGKGGQSQRVYSIDGRSVTLSALGGGWGAKTGLYQIKDYARKLEPIECERLQTLPDNYTEGVSKSERRKECGNGWTVDVIAHILSFIPGLPLKGAGFETQFYKKDD